jgi:hypothetical protein
MNNDNRNNRGFSMFWIFLLGLAVLYGFSQGWFGNDNSKQTVSRDTIAPFRQFDDGVELVTTVEYVVTSQPQPTYSSSATSVPASLPLPQLSPTRDWTPELTAVNRNVQNAIDLVENCAIEKAKAATEFRVLDCQPVISNLEAAKQKQRELQETISANN